MDYAAVKAIHQTAVLLSVSGFFARGMGVMRDAAWVRGRLARTLPHIIDTLLLASALWLAWQLRLSPLASPWLAAKILGLLVYIGLGMLALRPGRPMGVRIAAWLGALASVGWIASVAITKQPLGVLAHLF